MFYEDAEAGLVVCLDPLGEGPGGEAPPGRASDRCRVVGTVAGLQELVAIAEAGLDDWAVQHAKVLLWLGLDRDDVLPTRMWFRGVVDGQLGFALGTGETAMVRQDLGADSRPPRPEDGRFADAGAAAMLEALGFGR